MSTSEQARERRIQAVENLATTLGYTTDTPGLTALLRRVLERANDFGGPTWEASGRYELLLADGAYTPHLESDFSYLVNEARTPELANQRRDWLHGHPWGEGLDPLVAAAELVTDLMCALHARGADANRITDQLDSELFHNGD